MEALLESRPEGLYCAAGDFYVDPLLPVARALVTHAHGDHLHPGCGRYFCAEPGEALVKKRVPGASVEAIPYGKPFSLGETGLSFHPAGHILGSSHIRIESRGDVWVMSGDYKRDADPTCEAFSPVPCDTFITEATFGYPVFRWPSPTGVAAEIFAWWEKNRAEGKTSLLFCYALGKAQRLLAELARLTERPVLTHGAVESLTECYRRAGVRMLPTSRVGETEPRARSAKERHEGELVLAPPSAMGSAWLRRFRNVETAFASGWMRIRGNRRRRGFDRGFTLSDHADWPSLLRTIRETGAKRVLVTHGSVDILVRYLREKGTDARPLATGFQGEVEA